ncbi:DUF3955 domain-containing protein [Rhodobacteraceae bacterium F11138]|nr:DUF3955 domain-containing protein [Rhodobacteraceae bacterium F11138]
MSRTFLTFLTIGLTGLGCMLLFPVLGASVDARGVLHEPFFLLPVGFSMMFLGILGTGVSMILHLVRKTA